VRRPIRGADFVENQFLVRIGRERDPDERFAQDLGGPLSAIDEAGAKKRIGGRRPIYLEELRNAGRQARDEVVAQIRKDPGPSRKIHAVHRSPVFFRGERFD
jgi:hypothetical protein